jgi:Cellulase (glycosyl hydrolase family 5)
MQAVTNRRSLIRRRACMALGLTSLVVACSLVASAPARASRSEWSIFEDHPTLVRSGPAIRQQTLDSIKALGADTLRIEVKWSEVAPRPGAKKKPRFTATDPAAYPGFEPYDDLVRRAFGMGFRVMITLAPDAPRWATAGGRGHNYGINASEFAAFARAVGHRYSGTFGGLPAIKIWSIWNEPNHIYFISPRGRAPGIYRAMVQRGVPALRAATAPGSKIFVGELAPVGTATKVMGPLRFLRGWLCLDKRWHRIRGGSCRHFKKVSANAFAHHPYGPSTRVPATRDIINMLAIRRLGAALDRAARAGRITRGLPIYNTEFGYQTNPPDPFVSTSPARQAELLNQMEEYSYRYARLKSYSQYLLYDDVARAGSAALRWAGFQTGLRFANGRAKPSFEAFKLAIVIRKRGRGVSIWGHVRPGTGTRYVQLQRRSGGRFVADGQPIRTNAGGYFSVTRGTGGQYRYQSYGGPPSAATALGVSRVAQPR